MSEEKIIEDKPTPEATLLMVDDESNILTSLNRLFRPSGYKIITATSGAEGLKILEYEHVDLIISDMRMPEMTGAEFLEQVAQRWPESMRILLTGYADVSSTVDAINKGSIYKYISKPWDDNDIKLTVKRALELRFLEKERNRLEMLTKKQNAELQDLNVNLEAKVMEKTKNLQQTMSELKIAHESLKNTYTASVSVFSNLIEIRDKNAAGHSRRVAEHAYKLALKMGLGGNDTQDVMFAALLHDIGKLGLSDSILSKPFHELEQKERLEVIKHPIKGQEVLMSLEPLQGAAKIIRSHHEQYDGKGYPEGLRAKEIPKGARILSIVSDYDALQLGTLWTKKMSAYEAMDFIHRHSGSRYDPEVVKFFGSEHIVQNQPVNQKIVPFKSNGLQAGMRIERDLLSQDGVLLLSKGYVLDDRIIKRIQNMEESLECEYTIYVNGEKFKHDAK